MAWQPATIGVRRDGASGACAGRRTVFAHVQLAEGPTIVAIPIAVDDAVVRELAGVLTFVLGDAELPVLRRLERLREHECRGEQERHRPRRARRKTAKTAELKFALQ